MTRIPGTNQIILSLAEYESLLLDHRSLAATQAQLSTTQSTLVQSQSHITTLTAQISLLTDLLKTQISGGAAPRSEIDPMAFANFPPPRLTTAQRQNRLFNEMEAFKVAGQPKES